MKREDILERAAEIVTTDRNVMYGEPENNFENIARLWSAYLMADIDAHDVGMMMVLFKVARTGKDRGNIDTYIDIAGYAACAGEIFTNNNQPMRFDE